MSGLYGGRYIESGILLGQGAFGVVHQTKALENVNETVKKGQVVAVKTIGRVFRSPYSAKCVLRELKILKILRRHCGIVQLLDIIPPESYENFDKLSLVFQCADSDLKQLIKSNKTLTLLHVAYIMYQLCNACMYMHSAGIVHRDLKPGNILIVPDFIIKVCDFGLARGVNCEESTDAVELMEKKMTMRNRWKMKL